MLKTQEKGDIIDSNVKKLGVTCSVRVRPLFFVGHKKGKEGKVVGPVRSTRPFRGGCVGVARAVAVMSDKN
jgi:hypothetical protein